MKQDIYVHCLNCQRYLTIEPVNIIYDEYTKRIGHTFNGYCSRCEKGCLQEIRDTLPGGPICEGCDE